MRGLLFQRIDRGFVRAVSQSLQLIVQPTKTIAEVDELPVLLGDDFVQLLGDPLLVRQLHFDVDQAGFK